MQWTPRCVGEGCRTPVFGIKERGWRRIMKRLLSSSKRLPRLLLSVTALVSAGSLTWIGVGAEAAPATATTSGTVLQTNLVSDLPGAAAITDPNLVNPWGISESSASPFWISDNN